jgi:nitric-oxide synthase, bacterial
MSRRPRRSERPLQGTAPARDLATEAMTFLRACAVDLQWSRQQERRRRAEVLNEIATTGTYTHTPHELELGAKLAWRNHTRCIGQLFWRTLTVRDCRAVRTIDELAKHLDSHLAWAFNDGAVRPIISIFAPDTPGTPGPRIDNPQLVGYAGFQQPDGSVVGDPASCWLTERLAALGWTPEPGRFERLPLLIEADDGRGWRELDPSTCPDVPITHPRYAWFADLGLRWYAFPTVSEMRLEIGGITYPAAPFTGWYVSTEVGARNLGDADRYDMLSVVARRMGLDTSTNRTLWKDRALIELNVAVLSSYETAGVKVVDHHTIADQFHRYAQTSARAGEPVHAEWSWIVPPMAGSATPVYGEHYDTAILRPNFFRD